MKRFYKTVTTSKSQEGFTILLDGKPVKTPGRAVLATDSEKLAQELMKEWAAQEKEIKPDEMPLTQILSTRIDRVGAERQAMEEAVLEYLDTDLLCYRTDHPPELAVRQRESWDPHLAWFEERFKSRLSVTEKLEALAQDQTAHGAVKKFVKALDDDFFTALQMTTGLSGSLVLALAFVEGAADAETIFAAARVEERYKAGIYNEELHGPDPAQEKKDRAALRDLKAAQNFLALIEKI
ncbi:MAG: ATP12 chaperone family protein [Alphaproteobacteria bacterium]|nr:ATP12 chaperone family protein [Alphaproteobacteria bacterium]